MGNQIHSRIKNDVVTNSNLIVIQCIRKNISILIIIKGIVKLRLVYKALIGWNWVFKKKKYKSAKDTNSSLQYNVEFFTNQNPCIFNPCQNGGTCNIGNGTSPYFCNCTSSFTGFLYLKFIEKTFIIFWRSKLWKWHLLSEL